MPIGNEEETWVFILELDPVFKRTVIVAKVKPSGGTHTGENAVREHNWAQKPSDRRYKWN
jgi:hypothetical protein